jgi:undecaprenyl-diphosphatase
MIRGWVQGLTRYAEPKLLALLVMIAACGWIFIGIADEVTEGDTHEVDEALLLALRNPLDPTDPLGPGWFAEMMRDVTALGGIGILAMITLAAAGYLLLLGRRRSSLFVLVAVGGGQIFSSLAKRGFDRPRPDLVPHEAMVFTASFPSGHAMMSAVTYLTLAALLARVQSTRALKIYVLTLAVLLTVVIGISRVYLGVHWPSDVLAGWTAGAAWALACWLVIGWIEGSGQAR